MGSSDDAILSKSKEREKQSYTLTLLSAWFQGLIFSLYHIGYLTLIQSIKHKLTIKLIAYRWKIICETNLLSLIRL
jgi:hypothetical protein